MPDTDRILEILRLTKVGRKEERERARRVVALVSRLSMAGLIDAHAAEKLTSRAVARMMASTFTLSPQRRKTLKAVYSRSFREFSYVKQATVGRNK
ncbi:MAG: hypothetical protein KIT11_05680 [Fimbriimonadaceae bacterium]|nr:hypothetical protein [Fimbriimonadaceae bacterium]QYK56616.1 MAG: hypothetical protein KF733_03835 [Fimbriimonadaceae bacterium]